MEILHITPPNTVALLVFGTNIAYFDCPPEANIYPAESYTSFEQFVTKDEAATRAVEINPDYNVNTILGPLPLDPVNVSPAEVSVYVGDSVTLNCEYSCGDCEVVYEWLNPGNIPIPGATQSHLTLNNLTEKLNGVYTCNVSTSNEKGQTGSVSGSFTVTVYPAITPGASELA